MTDFIAGSLTFTALYWLPGWIFLRRSGLDRPTRTIAAVVVSYAAVTAIAEVLGAFEVLSRPTLALALAVLLGSAFVVPLKGGAFQERGDRGLTLPLYVAAGFGIAMVVQAMRPALLRSNDALATWSLLAVEVADSGSVAPDSLQTILEGFPPSVGLLSGSISLMAGGFAEVHMFMVHPLFATLLLMTVVLLAGWFGGRRAAWIALIAVIGTPLLRRGILFHDDLIASFFVTAAALLGLRAKSVTGWAVAGAAAGSALAVKHLGIVGALILGVVLISRHPPVVKWLAAVAGWLVGLPWYLWNVVRFGNPVYPMAPERFGESADVIRVMSDHHVNRLAADRGSLWEVGVLTLALLVAGVLAATWRSVHERDRFMQIFTATLVLASAAYLLVWQGSGYATRHTLIVIPILAALAGYGLGSVSGADGGMAERLSGVAVAGFVGLLALTAWSVGNRFYGDEPPSPMMQTAPYHVLQAKWTDLRRIANPPDDPLSVFGPIHHAWSQLMLEDPHRLVFSFDNRSYYIPQDILSGSDLAALAIYDAPDVGSRHRALLDAGVGYVLDLPSRAERHPLYKEAFWQDLTDHPEFYEPMVDRERIGLYRVLEGSDG